ncbi:MAG: hypothetical protein ACK4FL_01970 [Microgenomates group bacterium]
MGSLKFLFPFFLIQLTVLFFLSKITINNLFYFLKSFIKNQKTVFLLMSLIFLPGTIVHELSHFFAATALFLKVDDLQIFPRFEGAETKLGHVVYEKKDFLRGFLVGVAPVFGGLFFFFFLSFFKLFPSGNLWGNIFFGYLVFAISSTMFSSKKDLVDFIYIIPTVLIFIGVIYVFDIKLDFIFKNKNLLAIFSSLFEKINFYLLLSLLTNLFLIVILTLFKNILKK